MLSILSRLIVAAGLIFAATTAAHADFVITPWLIATFMISAKLASVISFTLMAAASIGLSYLAQALAPKSSQPDISSLPGGTTGKLQTGGSVPRAFVVGRSATAGSLVYANTFGQAEAAAAAASLGLSIQTHGNTPNMYLVQVIALSDIPVTALTGLLVNSVAATYNSGAAVSFNGITIPEYTASAEDYLWIRFYDGTQVAADPQLVALFGSDPDRPYTSARIGTGVAYAVLTSVVNSDLFPGFPQFKFVLDGIKLYDRRYDTSVGGSGSQRWATPSTWAHTKNPTVIAENILRGISYGGSWVYGAQTVTETQLPFASWTAAASECDTAITLAAGGTEPQFEAGGEIRFDVEPAATLEELLKGCNGRLAEIGGTYKVRAGAAGSAVFSFTDGDILSTEQQTFDPFPGLGQTINAVTAKYISPAEGYVAKDAPPLYDATLETADGGRRQAVDVNYSFVTSGTQVQRLMRAERDNHRAMRSHGLPMPPEAFVLEPLDVVSWTSTRNGYSSKLLEITSAEDLPSLNMGLVVKEIDPNAYDWTAATDEQPITDGTIVTVRPTSQTIVDWTAEPWTILSDSLQGQPGIKLSWDASALDVDGALFQIRLASSSEVILSGTAEDFAAGFKIVGENLLFNTAYQARGQYRPISVRDVTWSGWTNVTTPNVRTGVVALDTALNTHITTQLAEAMALLRETQDLIAANAAEQDAANWIDRASTRTAISASFGTSYAAITDESLVRASADSALAVRSTNLETTVNDPTTGVATRASASDVTALQSLTGDATHGNLALAVRSSSVEANIGGPSSSATVTITIASPAVVSWTAHGLVAGRLIKFSTTGALPTGITAGTTYYVIAAGLAAGSFEISTTFGGSAVNTSGTQSGTHTAIASDVASGLSAVSAAGMFRTIASAGSDGALALIDLEVSASVSATFASAGIELAAFVDPSSNPYSRVRLKADRTEISIPGITGGDPFAPFAIQNVNAVPQISLVPAALPDSGVGQRVLESGVTSGNISNLVSSDVDRSLTEWNNSGNGEVIMTSSVVVAVGSSMWIDFNTEISLGNDSAAQHGWIKVSVNGTTVRQDLCPLIWYQTGLKNPVIKRLLVVGLSAGDAVVTVTLKRDQTGTSRTIAHAPQLILTEMPKPNVVSGVATVPTPSVSYQAATYNGTSKTVSGAAIGAADADRVVVVALGWQANNNSYPVLTIGGITATRIDDGSVGRNYLWLFAARVPTGTTADIVAANFSDSSTSHIVFTVWRVIAFSASAYSHSAVREDSGGLASMSVTTLNPSVVISACYGDGAITGYSAAWTGTGTPTERVDTTGGSGAVRYGGYDMASSTAEYKNLDITGANSGSTGYDFVAITAVFK